MREIQVAHLHTLAGFEDIQHVSISLCLSWLVLPNNFRFTGAISSLNLVIILTTFPELCELSRGLISFETLHLYKCTLMEKGCSVEQIQTE